MIRSESMSDGIHLSLMTPRAQNPRDALIQTTVRVENVSDETIVLHEFRPWTPRVDVETECGEVVFRSDYPLWKPPSTGPLPQHHRLLAPGEFVEQPIHVVLRAERLRPIILLVETRRFRTVVGEPLTLTLVDEAYPSVTLHAQPEVSAEIEPATAVEGPLLYQFISSCRAAGPVEWPGRLGSFHGTIAWIAAEGTILKPQWNHAANCGHHEWRALAGWLDHPVATVEYVDDR